MRTFAAKSVVKPATVLALLFGVNWPSVGLADEVIFNDSSNSPLTYRECYAASDPAHPGPAAYFGEDICIDYQATGTNAIQRTAHVDGTNDVEWILHQSGTASIWAQSNGAPLFDGFFQVAEIGRDLGDDGDCIWSALDGGDDQRAWSGACAVLVGAVDFLERKWELHGDQTYYYETIIAGPNTWCVFDSEGGVYGAAC